MNNMLTTNLTGLSIVKDAIGLATARGYNLILFNLQCAATRFALNPQGVDGLLVTALTTAHSFSYEYNCPELMALLDMALIAALGFDEDDCAP